MKVLSLILWCTLLMWLVSCDSSDPSVLNVYGEDGGSGGTPGETVDTTAPVIIAVDITIGLGDIWDDNVAALDDVDGIISSDVVITGDVVDESTEGSYTLTYDVTDAAGNEAAQVSRVVTVSYCTAAKIADAPYANSNEAPTGDGVGTPYTICSLTQLAAIASNIATDKALDFDLKIDIDAAVTSGWDSGAGWTPIGTVADGYAGTFNGNNHIISNLFINRATSDYQAMFGYLPGATVDNIGLESVDITGQNNVGGVMGQSNASFMNNVYTTGTISGVSYVGGIIGSQNTTSITNSYSSATMYGTSTAVGGLVGYLNSSASVTDSYATGNVTSTSSYAGGLIGMSANSTNTISNCYAKGTILAVSYSGGLIGRHSGVVNDSYATGTATATNYAGGLIGYAYYRSTVNNSYATGTVTAETYAGGLVGYNQGRQIMATTYYVYINNSFATGDVLTCTTNCGGLIGHNLYAISTNNYRYTDHALDVADDADGEDGALNTTMTDYYDSTVEPLLSWDFTNDWLDNGTIFPTLR